MNPFPIVRAALRRSRVTAALFVLLIALAVALGIAISAQERAIRQGSARAADRFDLIVAAPGSQTDVLLSSIFLRPVAVELLPGAVAQAVLSDPDARFAAPLGFGDSFGDSPVVGTTAEFVAHLGGGLAEGRAFAARDEAVVGALVDVPLGARLNVSHGHAGGAGGDADAAAEHGGPGHDDDHGDEHGHDDEHGHGEEHGDGHEHGPDPGAPLGEADGHGHLPVTVTGRMPPTGTPWDRAVVLPIEYLWFVHGMGTGHAPGEDRIGPPWDPARMPGLPAIVVKPDTVAAAYGLRSRYRTEASMAFFPAEVLVEFYGVMGTLARVMAALTLAAQAMVVAAILAGLLAVLDLQRRRFAVLRALGAPRAYVFAVVWIYVAGLILAGAAIGLPLGWAFAAVSSHWVSEASGVAMAARIGARELGLTAALLGLGAVLALVPAALVYRRPVVEGLR